MNYTLYQTALAADDAYQDELTKVYGKQACNKRYQCKYNEATPELKRLAAAKHAADKDWLDWFSQPHTDPTPELIAPLYCQIPPPITH